MLPDLLIFMFMVFMCGGKFFPSLLLILTFTTVYLIQITYYVKNISEKYAEGPGRRKLPHSHDKKRVGKDKP